MVKDRNDEQRRARFEKYYSQLDKDGSGHLNYEEFKKFLVTYNKKEMPEKQYEFFFRGADIDAGGSIGKEELFTLVEALYKNDQLYINKLFFRAVDKDRSREIEADEFVVMAELNGREMSKEDAAAQIERLTGGKKTLTFPQMHKALTGQEVPEDTDPYDGKLDGGVQTRGVPEPKPLSEAEKEGIKTLISKFDKSGNGKLEFDEFLGFMKVGIASNLENPEQEVEAKDLNLKQMRFLYDGMDLDGSHNLDASEIIECLSAWKTGDFKWITKMIFRGADKDNSRKVSVAEMKDAVQNVMGKTFTPEEFTAQCKLEFGANKKELEFWEFYKLITGETIDKATDPYDGKLPAEKSKCCLLI
ncbi:hypothetical protein TRFO_35678 [Tritrichomonas foetus]|uniref:EF-hand domain-containing protein n=1 Tax=Tritrichomonas foetus TaxID=1144522 RepID=A0A1J4JFU4_9EUKA|nr:hypothetical protein [Tritrichomonas foetus]OHS98026.1 hypothetical protein TRFO_35678 [Tritrichomonas foetus]|eukprot:OHS98026.1 hypothetical protein TRFO_35678 [Tritrichomonas foetus]